MIGEYMNSNKKIAGIIFIVIGSIMLIFGLLFGGGFILAGQGMEYIKNSTEKQLEEFKEYAVKTTGTIVSSDDGVTIVRFEDEDGGEHEISINSSSSALSPNDQVEVYYEEDDLSHSIVPAIQIELYSQMGHITSVIGKVALGFIGGIGALLLLVGIILLVKYKKEKATYDSMNVI